MLSTITIAILTIIITLTSCDMVRMIYRVEPEDLYLGMLSSQDGWHRTV